MLNQALIVGSGAEQFCTATFAVLDIGDAENRLVYASGGHPPLAVLRADAVERHPPTGALLGILTDAVVSESTIELGGGDSVVFYTDGISEARTNGEEFGDVQMWRTLSGLRDTRASAIAEELITAARSFGRTRPATTPPSWSSSSILGPGASQARRGRMAVSGKGRLGATPG